MMCETMSPEVITAECLGKYDNLRLSPNDVITAIEPFSHVVQVTMANDNTTTYRLCHLTSMLPTTTNGKNLQLDFGLYSEGAGLLAMVHFNNRDVSLVPDLVRLQDCDVRFTMEFQDTQFSPIEACRALTQDVLPRKHSLESPQPVSVVGATRSAVSGPLAILSGVHDLPIVSYGSTSSQLDSVGIYPFFGRTVPTNQGDAQAAMQYLRGFLGVTHCGVMFVRDGYGTAYHRELLIAARQLEPPMEIVSAPYDPDDQGSIAGAVKNLRASGFKFFFGVISTFTYNEVMREAHRGGIAGKSGYTWLLSDGSGQLMGNGYAYDASTEADIAAASSGVGIVILDIPINDEFTRQWRTLNSNPALMEYFVSKHDPQLDFTNFEFYDTPTHWDYFQYDAVMALGFACCEVPPDKPTSFFTGPELFEAFHKTSFQGSTGFVNFETTGTRDSDSVRYKVVNVVARPPNEQNLITFESTLTSVQNDNLEWMEVRPFVYSDGTTNPPPGLPPVEEDMNLIDDTVLIFGLTLAGIIVSLSLGFAAWTVIFRKNSVVRMTQPFFLSAICFGTLLMGISVILMSLQEPVPESVLDVACMSVIWFLSLGFVVTFSALLSKTLRIAKLASYSGIFRRVVVRVSDVLVPFIILFTLNLIILVSWTVVSPLRWTRVETNSVDQYGRVEESYGTCSSERHELEVLFYVLIASVDFTSLLFANVANYRARKISGSLHEARYISLSLLILLEAALIGYPALLVVNDRPSAYFILRAVLVSIVCGAVLLPLFVPKIIQAIKADGTERNRAANGSRAVATVHVSGTSDKRSRTNENEP